MYKVAQQQQQKGGLSPLAKAGIVGLGALGAGRAGLLGKAVKAGVVRHGTKFKGQVGENLKYLGGVVRNPKKAVTHAWKDMGHASSARKQQALLQKRLTMASKGRQYEVLAGGPGVKDPSFLRRHSMLSHGGKTTGRYGTGQQNQIRDILRQHKLLDTKTMGMVASKPANKAKMEQALAEIQKIKASGAATTGDVVKGKLWRAMPGERAVMGGLIGTGVAGEAMTKEDASGRKRGLIERGARAGMAGATGVLANPLFTNAKYGLIAGTGGSEVLSQVGNKGVSAPFGRKRSSVKQASLLFEMQHQKGSVGPNWGGKAFNAVGSALTDSGSTAKAIPRSPRQRLRGLK